jgi:hypothetical protein
MSAATYPDVSQPAKEPNNVSSESDCALHVARVAMPKTIKTAQPAITAKMLLIIIAPMCTMRSAAYFLIHGPTGSYIETHVLTHEKVANYS